MSQKCVVPDGMLRAACVALRSQGIAVTDEVQEIALEAAIQWLVGILPLPSIADKRYQGPEWATGWNLGVDAIRRMFLPPEVPEAVKKLLGQLDSEGSYDAEVVENLILEAYKRGKSAK